MSDPKEIYLAPKCCVDPEHGRCWSEEDEWPVEPGDKELGHESATRYVRADLASPTAETMDARRGMDELEDGADFRTYGISIKKGDNRHSATGWWENQIHVYGDEVLRDRILAFLTGGTHD